MADSTFARLFTSTLKTEDDVIISKSDADNKWAIYLDYNPQASSIGIYDEFNLNKEGTEFVVKSGEKNLGTIPDIRDKTILAAFDKLGKLNQVCAKLRYADVNNQTVMVDICLKKENNA